MALIDDLYRALREAKRVAYFNANKTELNLRCPYCGDSIRDKTHAHLYVSVSAPYSFFCQRCETSGILNDDVLNDIGVFDDEIALGIHKEVKRYKSNTTVNGSSLSYLKFKKPKFPKYQLTGSFKKKLKYMEDRLGVPFGRDDLLKYRIIGSLEDFLVLNGMEKLLDDDRMSKDCYLVDKFGLGWLSRDCSHATFRYIDGDFKRRFKTICLDPFGEGSKIYTIRSDLELMAPEVNVVMTEGVFDLLSVYNNFFAGKQNKNHVFCAINGKGFNLFPTMLMRMGFLNMNLTIYSDNDVSLDDYQFILPEWRYNKIRICYNQMEGQKDFGVRKDLIKPKMFKLK
jgi:hypothetical protein